MLNWLFGMVTMFGLAYIGIVIAVWYEEQIDCWYCRILKALSWPYTLYTEWRY